jgi:hypothetical protein
MTARDHNNLFGIFVLIQGGIVLLIGLAFVVLYGILGATMVGTAHKQEDQLVGGVFVVAGVVIGAVCILLSIFYFFTGLKIRKQKSIGRVLGIVVSVLSLFSFPLGTALGIYGLWFLLGDMGKAIYSGQPDYSGIRNTPPPSSWQ